MPSAWEIVAASSTLALAVFTGLLAAATFVLARQAAAARQDAPRATRRRAMRAALIEQVENCRVWTEARPGVRTKLAAQLAKRPPSLEAARAFLTEIELPPGMLAYMLWLLNRMSRVHEQYAEATRDGENSAGLRWPWMIELDQLQTLACLLGTYGESDPDLRATAESMRYPDWTRPVLGPPDWRVDQQREIEAMGAPQFPTESLCAPCSPRARDRRAAGGESGLRALREAPGTGVAEWIRDHTPDHAPW